MSKRMHQPRVPAVFAMILASLWAPAATLAAGTTPGIIPQPVACEPREGTFSVTPETRVVVEGNAADVPGRLVDALAPAMGFRLNRADSAPNGNVIRLHVEPSRQDRLGGEGYELDVTTRAIEIRAAGSAGLFYGVQTLRQLLPPEILGREKADNVKWTVPCVRVTDYPRFQWRGLLIDPGRHFIPVPDVERFIDAMALHKFNRLQIHFTDDQGWRIEIKKYPRLVEVGSKMDFTTISKPPETWRTGASQPGGFYTQEEIRHLVRYAADRNITIVPEIEMPAHTGAAIVSYPQIGLYPEKLRALPVDERWNANERVLAPRPQTVAFMQDVLTEVIELFPSKYIHIGGDEANIEHWKKSPEMQTLIQELGLRNEEELHSWFIRQMDAFLTSRGRQLVGWDEILQGGLAPGAVVMSWRGEEGGITAARAGHPVVMAPTSHTYFDYYQGPAETEPKAIGGDLPLEKVYAYEPIPAALNADQAKHVLGGQGQLWGEFISTESHRQYMTWPRSAALAEVLWSRPQDRNYERFLVRLTEHLKRLKAADVNYRSKGVAETIHGAGQLPGVGAAIQGAVDAREIAGAVTVVVTRDKVLHLQANGLADIAAAKPMQPDSRFWIASMTKPVTAVAVLMLQDEGRLNVADPVAKYIPAFADLKTPSGKPANLTIAQILTHTSGLGEAPAAEARNARTLADLVPLWLAAPMQYEPGARWQYTQSGINLAGRIVEVVSGLSFDAFVQQRICDPLGMKNTTFYPAEGSVVTAYAMNRTTGSLDPTPPRADFGVRDRPPLGNGGLYSTGPDYARFCQMLLGGGTLDGRRYLSPAAMELLTKPQTGSLPCGFFQSAEFGSRSANYGWGIGTCILRTPHEGVAAMLSPGTFGHGGAWGTQAWIDPVRGVAYVLMVQRSNFPNSDASDVRRAFQQAAAGALARPAGAAAPDLGPNGRSR